MTETKVPAHVAHGTSNAYSNYKCRCELCRKGQGERNLEYRLRDPERFKAQRRAEYAANPDRFKKVQLARYRRRRLILDRYKRLKGCFKCGYRENALALEFHHRDPLKKEFNISEKATYAWDRLKAEVAKCEVICSNCHRILEGTVAWRI